MGKRRRVTVYDYLYSLDWGICYGPIDSYNQVRVKDKPIFCGGIRERKNVCIDLPDLFGGSKREGGVYGVLEAYMGDNNQLASAELAAREGLTPSTFPGYRGVAHLFFRGYSGAGFRWATNNPYVGDVKVNLTSIPRRLGAQYSVIWPMGLDNPPGIETGSWQGAAIPLDPITGGGPGLRVLTQRTRPRTLSASEPMVHAGFPHLQDEDLDDSVWLYGPAQSAPPDLEDCEALIEARGSIKLPDSDEPDSDETELGGYLDVQLVSVTATLQAEFMASNPSLRTGQLLIYIECYAGGEDQDGNPLLGQRILAPGASFNRVINVTGEGSLSGSVTVPPETAYVRVWTCVNRTFPIWTSFTSSGGVTTTLIPYAYQHCTVDGTLGLLPDANPAHIIYECMTNPEWGKGEDPSQIDVASFQSAAETLFNERFGLSMAWRREDTVENFVQEILDHIKAFLFQHPATGLWTLKLLRDDYVASSLPWLTPDNCTVKNPKRRRWGETINEIVVSYTDPASEEDATVSAHNIANMAIQGGTAAETRNYYGIRNANLAQVVANRDVMEAGTPLWSGVIEVDRSEWQIVPGDVRRLSWPDESISEMVVRVMSVDYGQKGSRTIKLNVVEDIFSVAGTTFTQPQPPIWQDDLVPPTPLQYAQLTSVPMPELMRNGVDPEEEDDSGLVRSAFMAFSDNPRPLDVQVRVQTAPGEPWSLVATVPPLGLTFTDQPITANWFSRFPRAWIDSLGSGYLQPGDILMLGDDDLTGELVLLHSFVTLDQEWSVRRGIYDTVPRDWPEGTRLWKYPDAEDYVLAHEHGPGDLRLRAMPRTRGGRLPTSQAPTLILPAYERSILPHRPANVQINGQGFGSAIYLTGPYPDIIVTWARRNRLVEDSGSPPNWNDPDITPEAGQTTHIVLTSVLGDVIETYTDLAGTSFTIPEADILEGGGCFVDVYAKRDGLLSFQAARRYVQLGAVEGWGYDWGNNWGG
jgi:hypothetical protein